MTRQPLELVQLYRAGWHTVGIILPILGTDELALVTWQPPRDHPTEAIIPWAAIAHGMVRGCKWWYHYIPPDGGWRRAGLMDIWRYVGDCVEDDLHITLQLLPPSKGDFVGIVEEWFGESLLPVEDPHTDGTETR